MPQHWLIANFLVAALLAFLAVGMATSLAQGFGMLSQPGRRQSHSVATATGGGLGMILVLVFLPLLPGLGALYPDLWTRGLLPGLLVLCAVGWLDDRKPLSPALRLFVQVAVSLWLLMSLHQSGFSAGPTQNWVLALLITLLLVGLMNAWNFMDGSHGMAGGQGLFTAFLLAALCLQGGELRLLAPALAVAAVCLGFLPWNFPRPRVFMGDAGSVPLGFALGGLLVLAVLTGAVEAPVALLVPALFFVDAGLTLALRILRRERWYTAHRKHLYQRLIVSGWSHSQVLGLYQALNVLLVLPGATLGVMYPDLAWTITGTVYMLMVATWTAGTLKLGGEF